jgi:hypothetical protein
VLEAVLEDRLVIVATPSMPAASAIHCACRSVGKPGYGAVADVVRLERPLARTRSVSPIWSMRAPVTARRDVSAVR